MPIKRAKEVLQIEARAILALIDRIDQKFERVVKLIQKNKGRVVLTGMGKPGIIATKISATLASLGTPSLFLHPAEAIHGDLGRVTKSDLVIALSNSGETEEITRLLPLIKKLGAKLIAITGNTKSTLARYSDLVLDVGVKEEACLFGLAPTASTTAMLALGDAIAIAVLDKKKFKIENYAFYHPGGSLGKKLLRVEDLMRKGDNVPIVHKNTLVKDTLVAITSARAGCALVQNNQGELSGIFTDGDIRRHLESQPNLLKIPVFKVMTKNPITIKKDKLAAEALKILKSKKIDELAVVDQRNCPVGLLDVQDLLKAGIV
ncbi:MAG: KpsF/GutQ family sugar-phosphate isomerase [Candidatus Omnitrophota bacterium]